MTSLLPLNCQEKKKTDINWGGKRPPRGHFRYERGSEKGEGRKKKKGGRVDISDNAPEGKRLEGGGGGKQLSQDD